MKRKTDQSTFKSTFYIMYLITAMFLVVLLSMGDSYGSHYKKLSKKELAEKHANRFTFFHEWEPKIRIRPSKNPRIFSYSTEPLPKSIDKKIKRSAIFTLLYFDGQNIKYDWKKGDLSEDTPIYGMSMSKSITSYLIGKAYCKGRIKSLTDTIGQYTESFNGSFYENVRIIDALNMASGDGNLYPNSKQGSSRWKYYTLPVAIDRLTIKEAILKLGNKKPTKLKFAYTNANTDALAAVLVSVATEGFAEFASVNLSDPAGFRYDSYFLADYDGIPHGFAYYFATRSDWLRAAIKIGEDFHSTECIGEYLRNAIEDTVKTRYNKQDDHARYGRFFWSKGILSKYPHLAMKGHGGIRGYIGITNPSPEVVMIHSVRHDYEERSLIKRVLK